MYRIIGLNEIIGLNFVLDDILRSKIITAKTHVKDGRSSMENKDIKKHDDIVSIANDVTLHSYNISKFGVQQLFHKMTVRDYVALRMLLKTVSDGNGENKIYLEEIAEMLKLPMGQVSRLARTLQERGLVKWKHDGNGEDGTYVKITDKGISSAIEQQETLHDFYSGVVEKFGRERFISLFEQLKELEEIMDEEIKHSEN